MQPQDEDKRCNRCRVRNNGYPGWAQDPATVWEQGKHLSSILIADSKLPPEKLNRVPATGRAW
jgi:hypothetical protein